MYICPYKKIAYMKKVLLTIAIAFSALLVNAQPPEGNANPGDSYGSKIDAKGAISLASLTKKLKKNESYTGKITGVVKESCAKKGCFINMELPDKTKMQVKFKDYAFFVPSAIVGKTVVLEGVAKQKVYSVDELKHYAEDAKKSQAEIDAITQPEKKVQFMADGVLVVK